MCDEKLCRKTYNGFTGKYIEFKFVRVLVQISFLKLETLLFLIFVYIYLFIDYH